MAYKEKLSDPRWQKKRLEILTRDNWTCKYCKDKETELHVHHLKYDGKPWDVDNDSLITVCMHCHSVIEAVAREVTVANILQLTKKVTGTGLRIIGFVELLGMRFVCVFEFEDNVPNWEASYDWECVKDMVGSITEFEKIK